MSVNSVVVLSAVRSAVGTFNGSLKGIEPAELAGQVLKAGIEKSGVEAEKYESIVVGNTIPTESRFPYVARVASIQAGMSLNSTAMALNRLCSSGLQAVVNSAQGIMLGDHELAIGGGVESMSRVPMGSDGGAMVTDPQASFDAYFVPQGISADLIATK